MFGWGKQAQEQKEQEEQAERVRLQSLLEKETYMISNYINFINKECK